MKIDLRNDEYAIAWVNKNHNEEFVPELCHNITMLGKDGKIRAVVVFNQWSDHGCFMHIFSDGSKAWCSPRLIRASFAHAFWDCSKERVTGIVDARNRSALAFDQKLGFKVEGIARDANGPDLDSVILGFTRRDWEQSRWWVPPPQELRGVA